MCSRCEEKKPLEEYHNLKNGRYGKCTYCKVCAKNWEKKWTRENREHIKKRVNKNRTKRYYSEHDSYRFKCLIRTQVRRYILDKKGKRTEEILGETFDNVRLHIEKQFADGMSWENHGEWHIDHIIPLSSGKSEEDYIKLNHYTNLQPLWAKDNMNKGAKLDWKPE